MPRGRKRIEAVEPRKDDPLKTGVVLKGHGVSGFNEWSPEPNMGDFKAAPATLKKAFCRCGHEELVHYGPNQKWCNTDKCECWIYNEK